VHVSYLYPSLYATHLRSLPGHHRVGFLALYALSLYLEDITFHISKFPPERQFPEVAEPACTLLRLMATLLPPPKRRKLYHGIPEPVKEPESPPTSIVVQFVNEEDGKALVPAVNLPADLSREALESLLNKLSRQVTASTTLDTRTSHFDFFLPYRTMSQYHSHSMSPYRE
jgi:hypothetical protein